jgi:prefoldin subunit 5
LVDAANADGNATEKEQEDIDALQEKIDKVKEAIEQYEETKETLFEIDQS